MVTFRQFVLSLFLTAPMLAAAQETNGPAAPGPATNAPPSGPDDMHHHVSRRADGMHESISHGILATVHRFDSFFGEDIIDDDQQDTLIRVSTGVTLGENGKESFNNAVSARLKFPQFQNRVQIIFDDIVERNNQKDFLQEVKDSEPLTGVRYLVGEHRTRYNLDLGVKIRQNPDAFIRARVSRVIPMDPWSLKLSQDAYWMMRDGPGELTQARLSRRLNQDFLFKATTRASWDESHDGITYAQSVALYQELSTRRALRWTAGVEMPTAPDVQVDKFEALCTYRQLIHAEWLYMEIAPAAEFPRERDFQFTPFISLTFQFMFGDVPEGFWQ